MLCTWIEWTLPIAWINSPDKQLCLGEVQGNLVEIGFEVLKRLFELEIFGPTTIYYF
ncbi:unnamed protein product [Camellia sinensis]